MMLFTPLFVAAIMLSLPESAPETPHVAETCNSNALSIVRQGNGEIVPFKVAIADTPQMLSRGLMMVDNMPEDAGMLFVFPQTREMSFWMKNTLIPLDMLFIDEAGIVASIHENAIPHDETSIRSGSEVRYVLEINGGLSEILDLSEGDKVINPKIGTGCAKNNQGAE